MSLFSRKNTAAQFEELCAPYERKIYLYCLRMLRHPQDAEDCAQEALLRAYRAFDRFRGEADVGTWLYRIAHNTCMDFFRRHRETVSLEELAEETGAEPAAPDPSLYLQMEKKERIEALRHALADLPPDQREVIVLTEFQGYSYDQTAQMLSLPVGTVKSRVNRAKERLKKRLSERELFADPGVQKAKGGKTE